MVLGVEENQRERRVLEREMEREREKLSCCVVVVGFTVGVEKAVELVYAAHCGRSSSMCEEKREGKINDDE